MYLYEHEMREPVCQWMLAQGLLPAVEFHLCHPVDIVGGRFGDRPAPRRIPPLVEVVAVELKLFAVATVIRQGRENRHLADKSYAAMPADRCKKMRENTLDAFYVAGVGLLSVDDSVSILIPAGAGDSCRRERVRKNLWRRTRHLYAI